MNALVLERRLWRASGPALVVATVVASAALLASTLSHVAEGRIVRDARPPSPAPVVAPARPVAVSARPDSGALVARNIFCSTCQPGPVDGGGAVSGPPRAVPRLIATQVGTAGTGWATVVDGQSGIGGAYPIGATLPGGAVVTAVERGAMTVRFSDGFEQRVALATDAAPGSSSGAGAGAGTPTAPADAWAERVRKVSDNRYQVDRRMIEELVSSGAGGKVKGVRIAPVAKDGKLAGLKVTAARDSLASALGLATGDVIERVDGKAIDSTDVLLAMYGRMNQLSQVELGITDRSGNRRSMVYDLQ